MEIFVTKRNGEKAKFDADEMNKSLEAVCSGLNNPTEKVVEIATSTQMTLYDGIKTEELDRLLVNSALENLIEDPKDYDKVASRLTIKNIYKKLLKTSSVNHEVLKKEHQKHFQNNIKKLSEKGMLDKRMVELFDLKKLSEAINIKRDDLFSYTGLSTVLNRYALKDQEQYLAETPQEFFMRIAMGLSYNEKDPTKQAIEFYNKLSKLKYISGGSTCVNAGTPKPSLSNCFLIQTEDSMEHIAKSVSDVLLISKATGGIGLSLTKLRSSGSRLKKSNTTSSGPTSFAKIFDVAVHAVVRGGKKIGAIAIYMENWHYNFDEFVDWRHNAGDDYMRLRTANTASLLSDAFMKRLQKDEDWYMFDPKETPDLVELYGSKFEERYEEYTKLAQDGKIRLYKRMPAKDLMKKILVSLQSTGHPWVTWKDPMNTRALNNNTGTIHMSNLCTEICLPQDVDNTAVCNLASVNISAHITKNRSVDWEELKETVKTAVRSLDNLIDINILPTKESVKSDLENRAIGLGVMGYADAVEKLGIVYDSEDSYAFSDRVFEFISYHAIDTSADLAQERGSYKNFKGSGWSKGMVPMDTLKELEKQRGIKIDIEQKPSGKVDWDALRAKVKKGIRNATLMAVAPNANIGLVAGTTPGMDARFTQAFSRNKYSGKHFEVNLNLVDVLQSIGMWDKVKYKIVENHGDISDIDGIPEQIKNIFKTSFTTSPHGLINVAARAQKYVDQAISRNMYLDVRDINQIIGIYTSAWQAGLKSTYYLHMKPRHSAEQSTTKVNKASTLGFQGFSTVPSNGAKVKAEETESVKEKETISTTPIKGKQKAMVCPIDPAERNQCDSCQ